MIHPKYYLNLREIKIIDALKEVIIDWELNDWERTQEFFDKYQEYIQTRNLDIKLDPIVLSFDIALLKVKNRIIPVSNDSHYIVNSICLPKSQIINERTESIFITGMGMTAPFGSSPYRLKKGMSIIWRRYDECKNFTLIKNVTRIICAVRLNHLNESLLNSSICSGDSGSPLNQQDDCQAVQIGITSFGDWDNDAGCGHRMGFLRVSENIHWIRSEIMNERFGRKNQIRRLTVSQRSCLRFELTKFLLFSE